MHTFIKVFAMVLVIGSMGALEIDKIGMTQAITQAALGIMLWVAVNQAETIDKLRRRRRV
ncbi:hypothetical protein [Veillonella caviae]|uniref:hypothetical protein n=1 Tax=Veillonella caviae TaxID=248316 RepID=UPI0023F73F99|nr:hypothetical protein [Veillonella caviae]